MHLSVVRLVQAGILAIGVSVIPLATVTACSCAMRELEEAIATADIAIVGTAVRVEPFGRDDIGEAVMTTWAVEGSRDAIATGELPIRSVADTGANCGASFAIGQRWLVLAYGSEGTVETNGCMQNRRLDTEDAEAEAAIAELLTAAPEPGAAAPAAPVELLGIAGALLLVGLVSFVVFRRDAVS